MALLSDQEEIDKRLTQITKYEDQKEENKRRIANIKNLMKRKEGKPGAQRKIIKRRENENKEIPKEIKKMKKEIKQIEKARKVTEKSLLSRNPKIPKVLVPEIMDFLGGKRKRKHSGINQTTGKLKKGYKYSGKKLKSGLPQIVKR